MKKTLISLFILLNSNFSFGRYINERNYNELFARTTKDNNICLYEYERESYELILVSYSAVKKADLRKAMQPKHSIYSSYFLGNLLSFGIVGRVVRGKRLDNLLSEKDYVVNNSRYNQMLDIISELPKTTEPCSFRSVLPEGMEFLF